MTCKELADFILAYTTGELSADVRAIFDEHLSLCPNCVEYLALYRATIGLGRQAFDDAVDAVDAGVPADLVAAILASRPQKR